jgi:hypothetical protein
MHFNAVTAARRPSLRNHLTHVKHAGQTGNPAHQNQEICAPDLGNPQDWRPHRFGGMECSSRGLLGHAARLLPA